MSYRITGLDPAAFADPDALVAAGAIRRVADAPHGYPCRITLEDAAVGQELLLLNHVSAPWDTPFRASHAIFVAVGAQAAARYEDRVPTMIASRLVSLRAFDGAGIFRTARLAQPGEADGGLRQLLADPDVTHIDIHTASWGCSLARAERTA